MGEQQRGMLFAFAAYVLWGLMPLFWMFLAHVNSLEILVSRIFWSFIFTLMFLILLGQRKHLKKDLIQLWSNKPDFIRLFAASFVISINWFGYIWAVNNGKVLETSLGYYINPLLTVMFGVIIFKEKLSRNTLVAVCIAAISVIILTVNYGTVPWISLTLAFSFATYGVLKKKVVLDATRGLAIETLFTLPFAILAYFFLWNEGLVSFGQVDWQTNVLLMLSGILTAVPLVLFAKGAQTVPLYIMGFIQYFAPTITFILGVFYFKESFTKVEFMAFSCIWLAVLVFTVPKAIQMRKATKVSSK